MTDTADLRPADAVAVIGAGPGGLAAARWLLAKGFAPVIFEAAEGVGGQWNPDAPGTATWPGMRANTSRQMTAFADLDHVPGTPLFPRREDLRGYLEAYARRFGLEPRLRRATRVESVARARGGWLVRSQRGRERLNEVFPHVVIATGRHREPILPDIAGRFTGALGYSHAAQYRGAARYAGASVVVAGCSISALEIASDLALGGAAEVVLACRRQRYVLPKIIRGIPTDQLMFTRAAAHAAETLDRIALAASLKAAVLDAAGDHAAYGLPPLDDDVFAAGIAQSQHFLPCVAEGRIVARPWIARADGRTLRFADGSSANADAIIAGTGYRPALPRFDAATAAALGRGDAPRLSTFALHPNLPGLGFVGMYELVGPYWPVLELNARLVAERFADPAAALPPPAESLDPLPMNALALAFARHLGVEPDPAAWPDIAERLVHGPLLPASFRLGGADALPDAAARVAAGGEMAEAAE